MIGPNWASAPAPWDENDWVRREIVEALAHGVPILDGRKNERLKNSLRSSAVSPITSPFRPVTTATQVASAWSEWQQLRVTEGSPIPEVANPRVQPASGATTPTLIPALLATVSSVQGGQLSAEFELEHDPAAPPGQGTGQIWTTTVTGVTSGNDAVAAVPAGRLQDGWKVRWRVRAVNGGFTSEWSLWQPLTVDVPEHYDTVYEYDRDGRLNKQIDANGNVRTFTYDLLGRRIAAHDPDAGDSTQSYDDAGRLAWSTNGKGEKVSYTYTISAVRPLCGPVRSAAVPSSPNGPTTPHPMARASWHLPPAMWTATRMWTR